MVYDTIILGSGVAGLTAGLYLARGNKNVMLIEEGILGGTTATLGQVDNYPAMPHTSGERIINNLVSQVAEIGVIIDFLHINHIDFDKNTIYCDNLSDNSKQITLQYKTLIIATGTSCKKLNIPTENKFRFKGLSYCAVCDGRLFKGKRVVVVTDGTSAKHDISYLMDICKDIVVVDSTDIFSSDKLNVVNNARITEVVGKDFVEGVKILTPLGEKVIVCDGIFVSLGRCSDISLFENKLDNVDMHLLSDENMHTNIPNVFVAGDVRVKSLRQIVTAVSDGAIAGTEAIKYLSTLKWFQISSSIISSE